MKQVRVGLVLAVATCLLVAGLSLAAKPAQSLVATLFVDQHNPACSDRGDGSATTPYCTISAAANATAGQTVQVATGTYNESVTVKGSGTPSAPVVFTAAPGAAVTVTGKA